METLPTFPSYLNPAPMVKRSSMQSRPQMHESLSALIFFVGCFQCGWVPLTVSTTAFILKCGAGPWLAWAGGPAFILKCGAGPWPAWAGGSAFILKCGAGPRAGGSGSRFRQIWC